MGSIKVSPRGIEYQNVFCKEVEKEGRGKYSGEVYTNYVGYLTVGNKVIKLSLNPEAKEYNGKVGYFITAVATNLTPKNRTRTNKGARF